MNNIGYGDFITNKITEIPYGQPFQTDMIVEEVAMEYAIPVQKAKPLTNVVLKRLADKGQLERFKKGVYYRTKPTIFGNSRPNAGTLEAQLLTRRGQDIIGYETGLSLMNQLGLTTLVPKKREFATNSYRKQITSQHIVARKPVIRVDAVNFRYLQLLDMIRDLQKSPVDHENPKALLRAFVDKYKLDPVEALNHARQHYSQKTLLFLVDVLCERV